MTTEPITVTIDGESKTLRPFKATKAIYAGAMVAQVSDQAKEITRRADDFRRQYADTHRVRMPEGVAVVRGWDVADDQWKIDDGTGERYIELPAQAGDDVVFMEVFGAAFDLARDQVLALVALVVEDDGRLFDLEDEGGEDAVYEHLKREGKALFRRADLGEMIDVAGAAYDMITRELTEQRMGKVRSIRGLFQRTPSRPPIQPTPPASSSPSETPSTPETSENGSPDSSTPSPSATAGTDEPSSAAAGTS